MWFRKPNATWSNATPQENRADLEQLAAGALAPGLVAYRDDRAVGWVSLAPREDYARLTKAKVLAPIDDKPVWSIVCFVVSKSARGTGVAAALLDAAVTFAREHGATTLEAYPVAAERGHVPPADAFHGTQQMFERAGFFVAEARRWNATTPPRPIMRREL
jgi:GNAT superfamily N-acetyltransferase